jgi:hypothetical protein
MNKTGGRKGKIPVTFRMIPSARDLLTQRAHDEGATETAVINNALTLYLTREITDESLLIAKMTDLSRHVEYIDKKIEAMQRLSLEWYQFSLMFMPEIPKDKNEITVLSDKSSKNLNKIITKFKHDFKKDKRFFESLLGDMLEEEKEIKQD